MALLSGLVMETQMVLVSHELVAETVVMSSGCELVMVVLAVHDGGWQQH